MLRKLKPYLLHLKDQFTSIALHYAIQLRSVYAIRIYERLKQPIGDQPGHVRIGGASLQ